VRVVCSFVGDFLEHLRKHALNDLDLIGKNTFAIFVAAKSRNYVQVHDLLFQVLVKLVEELDWFKEIDPAHDCCDRFIFIRL